MKNYKVTFGTGEDAIAVIEPKCCSFAECVIRLEYTGFIVTDITKVEEISDAEVKAQSAPGRYMGSVLETLEEITPGLIVVIGNEDDKTTAEAIEYFNSSDFTNTVFKYDFAEGRKNVLNVWN